MRILKQAWWAPLAGVLAISQLGVALAFIFGEGTSNLLDAESTAAGISLQVPSRSPSDFGLGRVGVDSGMPWSSPVPRWPRSGSGSSS